MEYERSIYRVYEKLIKDSRKEEFFKGCSIAGFTLGIILIFYLIIGHVIYYDGGGCVAAAFETYIEQNKFSLMPEDIELPWQRISKSKNNPGGAEASAGNRRMLSPYFDHQLEIIDHKLKKSRKDLDQLSQQTQDRVKDLVRDHCDEVAKVEKKKLSKVIENESLTAFLKRIKLTSNQTSTLIKKNINELDNSTKKELLTPPSWKLVKRAMNRTSFFMEDDIVEFFIVTRAMDQQSKESIEKQKNSFPLLDPETLPSSVHIALPMSYGASPEVQRLARHVTTYNLTKHYIFIDDRCYQSSLFSFSLETRAILDILHTFPKNRSYIRNLRTGEGWYWSRGTLQALLGLNSTAYHTKLFQILFIVAGIVLVSFATSLYTKIVTFLSPLILYGLIKLFGGRCFMRNAQGREAFMVNYYKAFPWVGIYLQSIRAREQTRGKSFELFLMLSISFMVLVFYFVYIALARVSSAALFNHTLPAGFDEDFLGLMAIVELSSVFFFRTRQSLHFGPRFYFLSCLAFFMYIDFTPYGFYRVAFWALNFMLIGGAAYCVAYFEIPAMKLREGDFDRPGENRPRTAFQPFFSLTWYHDLPPFWTIFAPFFDRNHFSPTEMSLVDDNHALMDSYLRGRFDQENNQEQQNGGENGNGENTEEVNEEEPVIEQEEEIEPFEVEQLEGNGNVANNLLGNQLI